MCSTPCALWGWAHQTFPESTTPFVYFLHDIAAELGKIARPDGRNAGVIQFGASAAAAGHRDGTSCLAGRSPSFVLPAAPWSRPLLT